MKYRTLTICFWLPLMVSCKTGTANEASGPVEILSNEAVLAKVYDPSYSVPPGFFVDARADTPESHTLYHVKDVSVSYELCTDDYSQALEWEAQDNEQRQVNGYYVNSIETDKYFEVVRELSYPDSIGNVSGPTSPGFSRVFKCNYVNRDGVDRNLRNGFAGRLNVRPLSSAVVRDYAEYLWQFTFFWPARASVLESVASETAEAYEQTLVLGLATRRGTDQCDLVEVVNWTFSVRKDSGQVSKTFALQRSFEALVENGTPKLCGA